jgi:hypothetical protein
MPSLTQHQSSDTTKLLLIGDNGSGKTGALASLASEGYNVRILDLDNGIDILKSVLSDPANKYKPDSMNRIEYETLTDVMVAKPGGLVVPKSATVWQRTIQLLDNWKTPSADFGPLIKWTPQDVLVIDSLSNLCTSAMYWVMQMDGKLGKPREQQHWYAAQNLIESVLQLLYDANVKANVIINCHITYIGEDNGPQKGYPESLGKALSPKIGKYFNSILLARTVGSQRKLITRASSTLELKSSAPSRIKPEYPIETGLAEYFKAVRGQGQS